MKNKIIFTMLIFLMNCTFAQTSYLCISSIANGLKYDKVKNSWVSAVFLANEKYIFVKDNNKWEWREFGKQTGFKCDGFSDNRQTAIGCDLAFGHVWFNRQTLRFGKAYYAGYVNGETSDTPSIELGTCTVLEK